MAEHFIGAVLVADIQVTFKDGTRKDILQKIHAIGPNLAVGFSGSVRFGFEIVADLRNLASQYSGTDCPPVDQFITAWYPRAADRWARAAASEQKLGCSLLLVGADDRPGRTVRVKNSGFSLRAPDFTPTRFRKEPISIGSGANVDKYTEVLEMDGLQWLKMLPQFNLKNGGPLDPFGGVLGKRIDRNPTPGISPHLHLCLVRCHDIIWRTNDRDLPAGRRWTMPKVANSWTEFQTLCSAAGAAADDATA